MSNSFFPSGRDVLAVMALGYYGDVFRSTDYQSISCANSAPQARQVSTVVVTTADNNATFTVTIDGVNVTYVSDASGSKPEISAGLKAAIEVEPGHRVTVVDDGVDTLTITGLWPGVAFELSASATGAGVLTAAAVTAADEADPTYPGRAMIRTGEVDADSGNFPVKAPVAADFTAQSLTTAITTGAAASFEAIVKINGTTYRSGVVAHDTNATTTAAAIATAINGVLPANTVEAVATTGTIAWTAEVPGQEFELDVRPSGVTAAVAIAAVVGPSAATSLKRALIGASARRLDMEAATFGGDLAYPGNGGVEVTRWGRMVVERSTAETWLANTDLYVGVATSTAGKFYNTAGANRVHIGRDLITIDRSADNGLGLLRIAMGA